MFYRTCGGCRRCGTIKLDKKMDDTADTMITKRTYENKTNTGFLVVNQKREEIRVCNSVHILKKSYSIQKDTDHANKTVCIHAW